MFSQDEQIRIRLRRLIRDWVRPALVADRAPITLTAWDVPDEPVPFSHATSQTFTPREHHTPWSRPWGTTWFRLVGTLPAHWPTHAQKESPREGNDDAPAADASSRDHGRYRYELSVDLGFSAAQAGFQAEGTAYRTDGSVIKGLEPRNYYIPLSEKPGQVVDLYVEAASNPEVMYVDWVTPSHLGDKKTAGQSPIYTLGDIELRLVDTEAEAFIADVDVLDGWIDQIPAGNPRRAHILVAFQDAIDALDPDAISDTLGRARAALAPVLSAPATQSAITVHAVGHAHIDTAWLWPIRETIRKVARTFSNALHLIDTDPEFVFAASSAQQYEWMRLYYPDIFTRIQKAVKDGRWFPIGGQWIESDPYMIGGEAFIRQFTQGQAFFEEHFDVECPEVWLPDSFGYSAALPGIARHVGIERMLTQKLSWNDTNVFPHHTFTWEGIDGSQVLTHFPPVDTYNSMLTPEELAKSQERFREEGAATHTLVPFGYGDGGGGPTRDLIAAAHRQENLEGSPRVTLSSPRRFFDEAAAEYADRAPRWLGELYLENHRGVLTSQHRTKRGNRRLEHLLREAELWATTATVRTGSPYPYQQLQELWRTALLHQFHDILPGSSIAWVHREAEVAYDAAERELEDLIAEQLRTLAGEGEQRLVANPSSCVVDGIPAGGATLAEGTSYAKDVAACANAAHSHKAAEGAKTAQGCAHDSATETTGADGEHPRVRVEETGDGYHLVSETLEVRVCSRGHITSLIDLRHNRELVPDGQQLAHLMMYRDIPNDWDAWNIDLDYRRHPIRITECTGVHIEEQADGSATIVASYAYGHSAFRIATTIDPKAPRLDITTHVDWHERRKLLKLEIPVDLNAAYAQSDIQFGHVTRPIHTNTSWDQARFETVGHRWVRVEEGDYAIAVANDQTYGHGISRERGSEGSYVTIGESLLRSPMAPDPDADQGEHTLRTTVLLDTSIDEAIAEGLRINLPARSLLGKHPWEPLVRLTSGNASIEAVKCADDESGDIIVRLYETHGGRTRVHLNVACPVSRVRLVDGRERETLEELTVDEHGDVSIPCGPFAIRTVRITRA